MFDKLFLQILNMSFTASVVIVFVSTIRLFLKKVPKIFSYSLWSVVLFRLICPFSFESVLSLLPTKTNHIPYEVRYMEVPQIDTGIPIVNNNVNPILPNATPTASVNPIQIWIFIGEIIWLIGVITLLLYSTISLILLKKRLLDSVLYKDNIYISNNINTAFVIGIIKPKIYLPNNLNDKEREYILLHEQTHLKRFDHIVKIIGFIALCLHWFNPFVWYAFFVSGKDMEMSCDETVIKKLGNSVKKDYSSSLLTLATGKRMLGGAPLAFGEGDTKSRVKNVLNYKRPAFWTVLILLIIVVLIIVGLMANPKEVQTGYDGINAVILNIDKRNQTMLVRGTDENSVIGDQCVVSWQKSPFVKLDTKNKPKVITIDDFSVGDNVILFIDEVSESYPTKAVASTIQLQTPKSMYDAEKLFNARTKYIGDNSAVGNLIYLLPVPNGLKYDHIELETKAKPYKLNIFYSISGELMEVYDSYDYSYISELFDRNEMLLYALIDNVDEISISVTDNKLDHRTRNTTFSTRTGVNDILGKDARSYAQSKEKLQELIDFPIYYPTIHAIKFPAYNQRTESNSAIFDIEPFILEMYLPDGWSINTKGENDKKYSLMGLWTPMGIYNEKNEYVGAVGYNIYEETEGMENSPQAIYSQITLDNHYHFNTQPTENKGDYQLIYENSKGGNAVTKVYTSASLAKELGYDKDEIVNYGILSYNKDLKVYIAAEIDSEKITKDDLEVIAMNIRIVNTDEPNFKFFRY